MKQVRAGDRQRPEQNAGFTDLGLTWLVVFTDRWSQVQNVIDRDITRKQTYANKSVTELRQSCVVKVEVAVLDSPTLIVLTVSLCGREATSVEPKAGRRRNRPSI